MPRGPRKQAEPQNGIVEHRSSLINSILDQRIAPEKTSWSVDLFRTDSNKSKTFSHIHCMQLNIKCMKCSADIGYMNECFFVREKGYICKGKCPK